MAEKIIGRYRAFGENGNYQVTRWDGEEWQVMYGVPDYTTMAGAIRKAQALHKEDLKNGIRVRL